MTLDCYLEVESDKAEFEENGTISVEAKLEVLPRVGDFFFFDDALGPPEHGERDLRIELESIYIVKRVVHNMNAGINDDGKLYAVPEKGKFKPYSIYLRLLTPEEDP